MQTSLTITNTQIAVLTNTFQVDSNDNPLTGDQIDTSYGAPVWEVDNPALGSVVAPAGQTLHFQPAAGAIGVATVTGTETSSNPAKKGVEWYLRHYDYRTYCR